MANKILIATLLTFIVGAIFLAHSNSFYGSTSSSDETFNVEKIYKKELINKFFHWKSIHNRQYQSQEEEIFRMSVYEQNLQEIAKQNAEQSSYVLGENQFSDLTDDEWSAQYLSTPPEGYEFLPFDESEGNLFENSNGLNASVSWVALGKTGPVLNQGSCGSCWAFSATETLQSFFAITTGTLPLLSEQQLVDCSGIYGNQGCSGGWPGWALKYAQQYGQTTNEIYPYAAKDQPCKLEGGAYKIKQVINGAGCNSLKTNLNTQPTAVNVDAGGWKQYKSGVFNNCGLNLNHAVMAVGYDQDGNWVIQNSWGPTWGVNGYITLQSGSTCGVCRAFTNIA